MKRLAVFCALLTPIIVSGQSHYRPSPTWMDETDADSIHSWEALHYDLNLRVTPLAVPDSLYVNGNVRVRFTPQQAGLDMVDLHFVGLTVTGVRLGTVPCTWVPVGGYLYVALPSAYNPGDTLDLYIDYQGVPQRTYFSSQGIGIMYPSANVIYTQADPQGLRYWMPSWDEPWDKATLRQRLEFPSSFTVVANGILESVVNFGAWKRWTYFMDRPMATYLASFCAAQYDTFQQYAGPVSITNYIYPQHLAFARNDLARVPEMIQTYSEFFGAFPFSTFGYAEAPVFGGSGAMENQTMVTTGSLLFTGTGAWEDIFAHELAHQWFGDATGYLDWPEMWLSEGFATYAEALWHQHLNGLTGYHSSISSMQAQYMGWENPINPYPMYNPPWSIIWTPLTYEKGAGVLHMLRYEVGDSTAFFQILQDYFSDYCYGTASTQDLKTVAEQITGEDYDWFFDQWVYEAGYPRFEYFYTPSVGGITLTVAQVQNANLPRFRTHADLYCYVSGLPVLRQVTIEALPTQQIQVLLPATPDSIRLDPVNWILGTKLRRDDLAGPILSDTNATIADADSSGFLDPGESGGLFFLLRNTGLPTQVLTLTLTSLDPQLTVLDSIRTTPAIPYYGQYDLSTDPFPVYNALGSQSRWVSFRVRINQGAFPLDTLEFSLPVGTPQILLVDDDGGSNFQSWYIRDLDSLGQVYEIWNVNTQGYIPPDELQQYPLAIWHTSNTNDPLETVEQIAIESYLSSGGHLFLTSENADEQFAGLPFYANTLHATSLGTAGSVMLNGVVGDPISNGTSLFLVGTTGANNNYSPNCIVPAAGAFTVYNFSLNGLGGGLRWESGNNKLVYFSFSFEAISGLGSTTQRRIVLNNIINWLGANPPPPPTAMEITLTPVNPPILIPPNGGQFQFTATVQRNDAPQTPFWAWTRIKYPDGSYTNPLLGPIQINPPVGLQISRIRTQSIPGTWPAGVSSYLGYVHSSYGYPATDSSFFTITKLVEGSLGDFVYDAACTGEPFPYEVNPAQFPVCTSLIGSYPNPFNVSTMASFELLVPSHVLLTIWDISGRKVTTLVNDTRETGVHKVVFDGSALASGIYICRLQAGEFTAARKLVLLK